MGLVRAIRIDRGRRVQLLDELLVRVVPLSPAGEATERPDDDCERKSQEQQSGREP
jgi:hypothetical protein